MNLTQNLPVRVVALVLLLCAFPAVGNSQIASGADSTLEFRGIAAGASLDSIAGALHRLGGGPLRCSPSATDRSLAECRGVYPDQASGKPVELWMSAIDSLSGILTLKTEAGGGRLGAWRNELRNRYGSVETRVQGAQRMMQWVRRGRMIRLTWRREGNSSVMSLSLVDGRVLDGWGAKRGR